MENLIFTITNVYDKFKFMNSTKNIFFLLLLFFSVSFVVSCNRNITIEENQKKLNDNQQELQLILETQNLNEKQRYSIINQMANNLLATQDYQGVILFLTDWVENNPDDMYNSYWLLMTAYAYLSIGAEPVAEYYFDRILNQCQDLLVKGNSVHFMCLQNLIQISKTPSHRIKYFNELINRFSSNVNITELYLSNTITLGSALAGLLSSSGVGLLVLFKNNKNLKENFSILGIIYGIGVISGIIIDLIGVII